eukprot:2814279-Rhodomonas_salina.2
MLGTDRAQNTAFICLCVSGTDLAHQLLPEPAASSTAHARRSAVRYLVPRSARARPCDAMQCNAMQSKARQRDAGHSTLLDPTTNSAGLRADYCVEMEELMLGENLLTDLPDDFAKVDARAMLCHAMF